MGEISTWVLIAVGGAWMLDGWLVRERLRAAEVRYALLADAYREMDAKEKR